MTRWTTSQLRLTFALVLGMLAIPMFAAASNINITVYAPVTQYQNTNVNPCIFYGTGNKTTDTCPADPTTGWPAAASPTDGSFTPLTQTYSGSDYTEFTNFAGTSFILGLDVNDTSTPQTLTAFTVTFYDGSTVLASYALPDPLPVPSINNGAGYADYILSAGCVTPNGSQPGGTCTDYTPFTVPNTATSATFTFSYGTTGNDGADRVFLIPTGSTNVPEPATLLLLGGGVAAFARRRRLFGIGA